MAKMKIAQAQKIIKDSRYGAEKKKEARFILREAKKAGKLKPKKPKRRLKPTAKSKKRATGPKGKTTVRSKRKTTVRSKRKITTAKRKIAPKKKPTKKLKKIKKAKITPSAKSAKIKFYDVKNKKYVRISRADCKIRRNPSPRGGDRLIGKYKGRKLHTFVKKGFKL